MTTALITRQRIANAAVGLVAAGELEPEDALLAVISLSNLDVLPDPRPEFSPSFQNQPMCVNGHLWTSDTYVRASGQRVCRQCARDQKHAHRVTHGRRDRS